MPDIPTQKDAIDPSVILLTSSGDPNRGEFVEGVFAGGNGSVDIAFAAATMPKTDRDGVILPKLDEQGNVIGDRANQDRMLAMQLPDGSFVFAVFDGVSQSTHPAEFAEKYKQLLATVTILSKTEDMLQMELRALCQWLNRSVYELEPDADGISTNKVMGQSTIALGVIPAFAAKIFAATMGDSSVQLFSHDKLEQLTQPHSFYTCIPDHPGSAESTLEINVAKDSHIDKNLPPSIVAVLKEREVAYKEKVSQIIALLATMPITPKERNAYLKQLDRYFGKIPYQNDEIAAEYTFSIFYLNRAYMFSCLGLDQSDIDFTKERFVHVATRELNSGDRLVLASDGARSGVSEQQEVDILGLDPTLAVLAMLHVAQIQGQPDDRTIHLLEIQAVHPREISDEEASFVIRQPDNTKRYRLVQFMKHPTNAILVEIELLDDEGKPTNQTVITTYDAIQENLHAQKLHTI